MNILVLTPLVPYPPHDGDKLRLFHFLEYLHAKGHRIDLFCLTRVPGELEQVEGLRPLCRRIHVQLLTKKDLFFNFLGAGLVGSSLNVGGYFSPELRDALQAYWGTNEGKSIDVVLSHRLRMAPAAFQGNPGKPVVLELTDCLSSYTRQFKKLDGMNMTGRLQAGWNQWFLPAEETQWSAQSYKTVLIADAEVEGLVQEGADRNQLETIPNGVEAGNAKKKPEDFPREGPVLCFVGSMVYAPNEDAVLWFAKNVWDGVREAYPSASFLVVGTSPTKKVLALQGQRGIRVTGWVPQVEPYLLHCDLSVAPLRIAAGMQNKVALGLALGKPVVVSSKAASWLPPGARSFLSIADGPEEFLNEVLLILKRKAPARIRAVRARAFILKNYRWNDSGRKLEAILKKAVESKI